MKEKDSQLILGTLRVAISDAAHRSAGTSDHVSLTEAAAILAKEWNADPAPSFIPGLSLGAYGDSLFEVKSEDTASQMGHPDPSMSILGSPRLALWFEIAASRLLPGPNSELTHVGVGILVHHLGSAKIGDEVVIRARIEEIEGRRVAFSLEATTQGRQIALGVHERIVVSPK